MPHLSNARLDFSLTDGASAIVSELAAPAEEFVPIEGAGLPCKTLARDSHNCKPPRSVVVFDGFFDPVRIAHDDAAIRLD
jgi:hypothetical protein